MSDAFDQAMAGLGGGSAAPVSAPAPASSSGGKDPYGAFISKASQTYNVDPRLIRAVIQAESSGKAGAVSDQGAVGLMQILPDTAKGIGVTGNLKDPQTNIMAGTQYLSQLLDQYGDPQKALMAYHGGPNQKIWGPKTQAYPGRVLEAFNGIQPEAPAASAQTSQSAQPAQADAFDQALAQVGQQPQKPATPPAPPPKQPSANPQAVQSAFGLDPFSSAMNAAAVRGAGGLAGGIAGAGAGLWKLATTLDPTQANQAFNQTAGNVSGAVENFLTPSGNQTAQNVGRAVVDVPGKIIGAGVDAAGNAIGSVAQSAGASPQTAAQISELAKLGANVGMTALGARAVARGFAPPSQAAAAPGAAPAGAGAVPPTAGAPGAPAMAAGSGRGSVGAAGTPFTDQARASGVPDAIVNKIAAAEQRGTLNTTAAGRHIEAGSLPVPVELTAGQASGDIHLLSKEQNLRAKNPELADRFNAQNGQIVANLDAIRDQVAPDVNVPSGVGIGQSLVDAYKTMDEPVRRNISDLYAQARGSNGAPALVDSAPQMKAFADDIGPTRFNALPSNVQQIFRDASANQVSLPAGFEVNGSSVRPMNVSDLMDIDKTLSGALRSATDGTVRHDIGLLRDRIIGSNLDPSAAGSQAFAAYRNAQAAARARFEAIDRDPAYKAAIGDDAPVGSPSALADDFVKKYIAGGGGKTANVENMLNNLSHDPANRQLIAAGLLDHIKAQSGINLRDGSGNVSQAALNKTLTNLDQKTGLVLGGNVAQTLDTLGKVARYTQEQPRGSYVNNSNTATTLLGHAGGLAGKAVTKGIDTIVPGAGLGSFGAEVLSASKNARKMRGSLEPGAGVDTRGLNKLR